jgi:hypothetical protein
MARIKVYKVQLYNAVTDAPMISRRMATRQGAEIMQGVVLENTEIEIDESQLERGEQWTARGFIPDASTPRPAFSNASEGVANADQFDISSRIYREKRLSHSL